MGMEFFGVTAPIEETPAGGEQYEAERLAASIENKEELAITNQAVKELKANFASVEAYLESNPHLKNDTEWIQLSQNISRTLGEREARVEELKNLNIAVNSVRDRWASKIFSGKDRPITFQ